jgi:1-deoxy-D-xylulose-5-phosphate reductoisomerase
MSERTRIVVLGASGSIGASALDVIAELEGRFEIVGLSCETKWRELAAIAVQVQPRAVAIANPKAHREAIEASAFGPGVLCLGGPDGVAELATWDSANVVLNGIVGVVGLPATLAALQAGKRVALANKESLVVGGDLVMAAAERDQLLPVDSEHCAIWQLLAHRPGERPRRIVLTASGGPFRGMPAEQLAAVDARDALAHPTWSMGPKITVDSATLANKGLEIIEAHHLFGVAYDEIDVIVHPQSIVHGMVEWADGALFAELGEPDMRSPIRAALTYPDRTSSGQKVDLTRLSGLTFEAPDEERFPALGLARAAGEIGGTAPAVFNAANEVAVGAFLANQIGFLEIASLCERVLGAHHAEHASSVETLMAADTWARQRVSDWAGIERTPTATAG